MGAKLQISDAVQHQLQDLHHHLLVEADDMEGEADMEVEVADTEEADMESAFTSTGVSRCTSASVVVADMEVADMVVVVADMVEADTESVFTSSASVVVADMVVADMAVVADMLFMADGRFYFCSLAKFGHSPFMNEHRLL